MRTSELSDIITQLWGLSLAKQCDLYITVEHDAIRIALSIYSTYVCSKMETLNSLKKLGRNLTENLKTFKKFAIILKQF